MTAPDGRQLRVVIADDDAFTLSLVSSGLESRGFAVTAATSVAQALEAVREVDPHAIISDLNFGTTETGAELLRAVADEFPWVGLVVLTSHRSPELAVANPEKIPAGAVYLVKAQLGRIDDLVDAVGRAISGQEPEATESESDDDVPVVTAAQAEVLRMLAEGASTRALAEARGTTVRAVETMLHRLFLALGLDTSENANPRVAAVTLWQRGGIRVR
ncbi:response regulator [Microcella frigidaquae]|uniref:DNA-binding NarL/FixJ family response regulator n=1 Tax=Microcella frigidaquae TaxID=424758 RepID=A0A840XFQ8_9MICO|nr:DNA-binding NarL/FixJ family response regulator [Microcella frigidaquae]NHN45124.1 response regulator transcription factor [Microcella frigidaquae]